MSSVAGVNAVMHFARTAVGDPKLEAVALQLVAALTGDAIGEEACMASDKLFPWITLVARTVCVSHV